MMTSLFGIRTITMGWVVLGHAYLNTVYSPITNLRDIDVVGTSEDRYPLKKQNILRYKKDYYNGICLVLRLGSYL